MLIKGEGEKRGVEGGKRVLKIGEKDGRKKGWGRKGGHSN